MHGATSSFRRLGRNEKENIQEIPILLQHTMEANIIRHLLNHWIAVDQSSNQGLCGGISLCRLPDPLYMFLLTEKSSLDNPLSGWLLF